MSLNLCCLQGRICNDIEVKKSAGGVPYCNFRIAVNRTYGKEKGTDFIPCVAYNRNAEFIEKYFKKGSLIIIEGELRSSNYEKNGQKITSHNVAVQKIQFTGLMKEDRTFIPADEDKYDRDDVFDFPL